GRLLLAVHKCASGCAVAAALNPAWSVRAPLGEHREAAVREHAQLADHAVTAAVHSLTAGAVTQAPALDPQRVLQLQRRDRGDPRVRQGTVHGPGPGGSWAGALATADRLVVGERVAADGDVVHRSLPLRGHLEHTAEGGEDDVDDARCGLGVPSDDGRG